MQILSDDALLTQLREEGSASFELLYKFYFPPVAAYVVNNSGSQADVEDIFQETIIVLLQKVRNKDFVLTSSLKTYLFAVARNLWLKRLRDNRLAPLGDLDNLRCDDETFSAGLQHGDAKEEKVAGWLTKITRHCQRIIKALFFDKEPMSSVMRKMGWKNKHTAANQQYKCIQQVKREKDKEQDI
ncbi:MAG: sigma-70 family RNA polymerase sigma factor [Chitinophagaceae bacterium]|nr:sigma-70 family RNA polymerase sigma factor [Chitinophagaceae bacterium]